MGGYRMRDVDEFLDELTTSVSALVSENERLRRQASASPVVGAPDLDDVSRQADEIIQRARAEAARILADARGAAAAGSVTPVATDEERQAVQAFLEREREFLRSLAELVQGHAEGIKGMVREARRSTAPAIETPAASVEKQPAAEEPTVVEEPTIADEVSAAPDVDPEATQAIPREQAPIRIEEPEPATRASGDAERGGDASLRELFWGEET
jgi:cell division septum initiation protein DivIVA